MIVTPTTARQIEKGKPNSFSDAVLLDMLMKPEEKSLLGTTNVTFTPGARSIGTSISTGRSLS